MLTQVALDRNSHMARCVAEAVRLHAPGTDMRIAAADLALPCGPGRIVRIRKASRGSNLSRTHINPSTTIPGCLVRVCASRSLSQACLIDAQLTWCLFAGEVHWQESHSCPDLPMVLSMKLWL